VVEEASDLVGVMVAARYYLDTPLFRLCESIMVRSMSTANVVDVLLHATQPTVQSITYVRSSPFVT
jgi:hypothetical protein